MSGLDGTVEEQVLGWRGPRGVAPRRMPKAEATELAPENRRFSFPVFFGEASERRPWASKRERSPGGVGPAFLLFFQLVAFEIPMAWLSVGPGRSKKPRIHWLLRAGWLALVSAVCLGALALAFAAGWQATISRYPSSNRTAI